MDESMPISLGLKATVNGGGKLLKLAIGSASSFARRIFRRGATN
jgi:hypothetical protein